MTNLTANTPSAARTCARVLRTALIVFVAAVPSWTHSARDEALSVEEARDRYYSLEDEERDRIHASYEQFKALAEDEREDLRQRGKNLARLSREVESRIQSSEALSRKLNESKPSDRRAYLRGVLREEARDKGMQLRGLLPERNVRELETKEGVHQRVAYLRGYKKDNISRVVGEMVRRVGRKLGMPHDQIEEIATLESRSERVRRLLELNVGLTEDQVIAMGLPFQITPQQWSEWQTLSDEEFFRAVLLHRGRITAVRLNQKDREIERPSDENLASLVQLLATVRQRITDFIELEDLSPRKARIELGKRKRAMCYQIIKDGKLQSQNLITELEVMNDADFYSRVREILMHFGGPRQIKAWSGVEENE